MLAVIVFHLHESWLPGGFLGVDVFFVISGFLITSLLVTEVAVTGRVDLRRFWIRRARRLLPALVVVVVVSSLVARLVDSDLVVSLARQVLGAATFSTNWVEIWSGQSYFDRTAPALFMNFWSLAVEEQFYLLWPVVAVVLVHRTVPRVRMGVALGLAVLSSVLMGLLMPVGDATRVYYGTDTHLSGLMLGAAVAFAWASPLRIPIEDARTRWGHIATPAAALVLALLMLVLSNDTGFTFRGGIVLAGLATCVLLVAAIDRIPNEQRTPLQVALDLRPVRWVGQRSYGIYLWHWPIILIVGQLVPTAVGTTGYLGTRLLAVALTLAVAEVSYRFVELPVRRDGLRASAARLVDRVQHLPTRPRRAVQVVAAVLALAFVAVVVTAPSQSRTADGLQANAQAAAAGEATGEAIDSGPLPLSEAERNKGFAMPTGEEIDGYGDSMMVGGVHALGYYFPGMRVDAKSNRRWGDGLSSVRKRGDDVRRAVVLDFGTNAGMDERTMTTLLDTLGEDRMVVIVDEYGTFSRVTKDNATLRRVIEGRPNVIVADWSGAVKANPDAVQADGIHPSLRGSHYYARAIQQAFAELSERHTGEPVELEPLPMP